MLELTEIYVSFDGAEVLKGASISCPAGSLVLLKGGNGSGKTTLLDVVSGRVRASRGSVVVGGRSVLGLSPPTVARWGVTRVLQQPRLLPTESALENILLGAPPGYREHPAWAAVPFLRGGPRDKAQRDAAVRLLESVGLGERAGTKAATLSFGEAKLVAVLRALMTRGSVFLFDEVLAGLGESQRVAVVSHVASLVSDGASVICTEHDGSDWMRAGATVAWLRDGWIE